MLFDWYTDGDTPSQVFDGFRLNQPVPGLRRLAARVGAVVGVPMVPDSHSKHMRTPGIHATEIPDNAREIYAPTDGEPPDPPAPTALIEILKPWRSDPRPLPRPRGPGGMVNPLGGGRPPLR